MHEVNDNHSLDTMEDEEEDESAAAMVKNDYDYSGHESFYRRIRSAGGKSAQSLCITIPRKFLRIWNVENGDYLLVTRYGDKMVIEKPRPTGW